MNFTDTYHSKGMGIRNTFRMPKKADWEFYELIKEKFQRFNSYTPEFFNSIKPCNAFEIIHEVISWDDNINLPVWFCGLASNLGKYFHLRILCTGEIIDDGNNVKETITLIGNLTDVKVVISIMTFLYKLSHHFLYKHPKAIALSRRKFKTLAIDITLIVSKLLENDLKLTEKAIDLISLKCQRRDMYVTEHFRIIKPKEVGKESLDYLVTAHGYYRYMKFLC